MARIIIDEEILDTSTNWENYTGGRVQEFIKKKIDEHDDDVSDIRVNNTLIEKDQDRGVDIFVPVVDDNLNVSSPNAIQNGAVATEISNMKNYPFERAETTAIEGDATKLLLSFYNNGSDDPFASVEIPAAQQTGEVISPKVTTYLDSPSTIKLGDSISFRWEYTATKSNEGVVEPYDLTAQSVVITVKIGSTVVYSDTMNDVRAGTSSDVITLGPNVLNMSGAVVISALATAIVDEETKTSRSSKNVTIVVMNLSTTLNPAYQLNGGGVGDMMMFVYCNYTVPIGTTLWCWLDGVDQTPYGGLTVSGNGQYILNIDTSQLSPGRHNIQFVAENSGLLSNALVYDFMKSWASSGETPVNYLGYGLSLDIDSLASMPLPYAYGSASYPLQCNQYESVTLSFAAWNPDNIYSVVEVYVDNLKMNELTVDRSLQSYMQTFDDSGSHTLVMVLGDSSIGFGVDVIQASGITEQEAGGMWIKLTANGKSNTQTDYDSWFNSVSNSAVSGSLAEFNGVNWNTAGWVQADNATSFLLTNGATALIDIKAFSYYNGSESPQSNGMVIGMKFKISQVMERGANIITCLWDSSNNVPYNPIYDPDSPKYDPAQGIIQYPRGIKVTTEKAGLFFGGYEDIVTAEKQTYNGYKDGVWTPTYIDDNGHEVNIGDYIDDNGNYTDSEHAAQLKIRRASGVSMDIAIDRWIDLYFVIYPIVNGKGLALMYLNGVLSRANRYTGDLTQYVPQAILFDSDKCDIMIRGLRYYRLPLKADLILGNFIVDQHTGQERLDAHNRNYVYDPQASWGDGTHMNSDPYCSSTYLINTNYIISETAIASKGRGRLIIIKNEENIQNSGRPGLDELFMNGVGKKDNFHAALVRWEPPVDANGDPIGDGFEARDVRIRIQGTSSVNYPYKNIRVYLTTPYDKNAGMSFSSGGKDYTWVNGNLVDGNGKKCKGYALRGSSLSRPQKVFCAKTDFVDSSLVMNTGGAHLFHNVMKALGYMTPPMAYDGKVRQAIDGIPCDLFSSTSENGELVYFGQFVFNNEKSKSGGIFGMEDNPEEFDSSCAIALEALENKLVFTLFQPAGSAGSQALEDQLEEYWDKSFEFNFPEDAKWANVDEGQGYDPDTGKYEVNPVPGARDAIRRWMGFIYDSVVDSSVDMSNPEYGDQFGWSESDMEKWISPYFQQHASEYFNIDYLCAYYIFTDYWASVDQRAKNILWRTWDGLIWYPTYYDGDTAMGIRNDAFLVYLYNITRNSYDSERAKYAFEGHDSWLWCLVLANFESDLRRVANNIRAMMTTTYMLNEFNGTMQGNWSERQYNASGKLKYIDTMDSGKYYPYTLTGNRELHRTQFITDRSRLLDARYNTTSYNNDAFVMRLDTQNAPDVSINLVSGDTYYFGYRVNNDAMMTPKLALEDASLNIQFVEGINGTSSWVYITGASCIRELDLSTLGGHLGASLQLASCSMLTRLDLRAYNGSGSSATVSFVGDNSRSTKIEYIDITGQASMHTEISGEFDVSMQSRLREMYAGGCTGLNYVKLPEAAPLEKLVLPANITRLSLKGFHNLYWRSGGLELQGTGNVRIFEFSDCPHINWQDLLAVCPNVDTIRIEGITGKVHYSFLNQYRNMYGIDDNGTTCNYPVMKGTVTLMEVISAEDLASLRDAFDDGGLTILECPYSVYMFDDLVMDSRCITNMENDTSGYYVAGVNSGFVSSGHAQKIYDMMEPVFGHFDEDTSTWEGVRMSTTNYNYLADGSTNVPETSYDDAMMYLPHCWYKGINDAKNQKKYICWSAFDEMPPSSGNSIKYTLNDDIKIGNGEIKTSVIQIGTTKLTDSGVIVNTGLNYTMYAVDVKDMKQVRWPAYKEEIYGVGFIDDTSTFVGKFNLYVTDVDWDFYESEGDYAFIDIPEGATKFVFSSPTSNHGKQYCLVTDSTEVEAIEPDWVEHKPCLVGIYEAYIDNRLNMRSITGKTVKRGTGTSTTWSKWSSIRDSSGNPTAYPSWVLSGSNWVDASGATINFTHKDFQLLAKCRQNGYGMIDYEMHRFVATLFYCVTGDLNSQEVCGNGTVSGTGVTNSIGKRNSRKGEFSSGYSKCLGIEGFFGHYLEWVDGVGVNVSDYDKFYRGVSGSGGSQMWAIFDPDRDVADRYRTVKYEASATAYIKRVRNGRYCDIVPTVSGNGASSNNRYADYLYYTSSSGCVLGRGYYGGIVGGGVAFAFASGSSSYSSTSGVSRLGYRGPIRIS